MILWTTISVLDEMSVIRGRATKIATSNAEKRRQSLVKVGQWKAEENDDGHEEMKRKNEDDVFMNVAYLTAGDIFVSKSKFI